MKIQIKNCKESPEVMRINVSLYNNNGQNMRIDTEKYQFVISGITEFNARRMIHQLELYLKDKGKIWSIPEIRCLSQYEIEDLFLEYNENEISFENKGLYEEAKEYSTILDEMVTTFDFLLV